MDKISEIQLSNQESSKKGEIRQNNQLIFDLGEMGKIFLTTNKSPKGKSYITFPNNDKKVNISTDIATAYIAISKNKEPFTLKELLEEVINTRNDLMDKLGRKLPGEPNMNSVVSNMDTINHLFSTYYQQLYIARISKSEYDIERMENLFPNTKNPKNTQ